MVSKICQQIMRGEFSWRPHNSFAEFFSFPRLLEMEVGEGKPSDLSEDKEIKVSLQQKQIIC